MYETDIREMLCRVLDVKSVDNITEKQDLRFIGMDSLNYMELIIEIEDHFNITIPDEKFNIQFFHNIYDICELVEGVVNSEQLQTV